MTGKPWTVAPCNLSDLFLISVVNFLALDFFFDFLSFRLNILRRICVIYPLFVYLAFIEVRICY